MSVHDRYQCSCLGVRLSAWKVLSVWNQLILNQQPQRVREKKREGGGGGRDKGVVDWEHIHATPVKVLEKSNHHI